MIDHALLPATPTDIILLAVETCLRAFDWPAFGLADLNIRHARNRFSAVEEFPCLTIRWSHDEPRQSDQDQSYYTSDEMAVEMWITLEVDIELSPENDDDPVTADPTGLKVQSAIAALAQRALRDEEGSLMQLWSDGVSDRGRVSDPDSTSDEGRFEQTVVVLYRVSTRDPSILLAQGMNL